MASWIRTEGGWKTLADIWIRTEGGWKQAIAGFVNTAISGWQSFFGSEGQPNLESAFIERVRIDVQGTTDKTVEWYPGEIVLVGTNYRWTNFTSGTYEFQRSEYRDNLSWYQAGPNGNLTVQPPFSNEYTYTPQESDFPFGKDTIFKFRVDVRNSNITPNKTASSESTWSQAGSLSGILTGYVRINYTRPKGIPDSAEIARALNTDYMYNISDYGRYYNDKTIISNIVWWETSDDITSTSFPVWTERSTSAAPFDAAPYKGKYLRVAIKGSSGPALQATDPIYSIPKLYIIKLHRYHHLQFLEHQLA
jgi:hypothetical protein